MQRITITIDDTLVEKWTVSSRRGDTRIGLKPSAISSGLVSWPPSRWRIAQANASQAWPTSLTEKRGEALTGERIGQAIEP